MDSTWFAGVRVDFPKAHMTYKARVEGSLMGNRAKIFFTDLYEIQIACFWAVRGVYTYKSSTWEVRQENQEIKLVFSYVTISRIAWASSHGTLTQEKTKSPHFYRREHENAGVVAFTLT